MQLIGINGFKQSGKGTTANIINGHHEGIVYEVGFADKLKIMAAEALGYEARDPRALIALMDEFKLHGLIESTMPGTIKRITGRQYLQNFGERARVRFGDSFWVDQVLPRPSDHPDREQRAITNFVNLAGRFPDIDCVAITDLRYPNEAERVLGLGGEVWEIVRPGLESDGHASEQPLPRELVTRVIDNDGTVDELACKVIDALKSPAV